MAGTPIKLGSAAELRLIFQEGSSITISDSGIQECSIKALCPDGRNVFNYIPAAGTKYDTIFANDYLPADFKVDRSKDSSIQIEYSKGTTALITLSFKRPDPDKTGAASRKVSVDTAFRFLNTSILEFGEQLIDSQVGLVGSPGIPEPVVTVRYNTPTLPTIGGAVYALDGTPQTLGFPICNNIVFKAGFAQIVAMQNPAHLETVNYIIETTFAPSGLGWVLTGLKAEPVADKSFYDVTETWRRSYFPAESITLAP
jgi:hypothetical protein